MVFLKKKLKKAFKRSKPVGGGEGGFEPFGGGGLPE